MSEPTPAATDGPVDQSISIEVTLNLDLSPVDVWPDNDVPDNWTAAEVLAQVMESGSFRTFLEDWDADLFGADVNVFARGKSERGLLR